MKYLRGSQSVTDVRPPDIPGRASPPMQRVLNPRLHLVQLDDDSEVPARATAVCGVEVRYFDDRVEDGVGWCDVCDAARPRTAPPDDAEPAPPRRWWRRGR